MRTVAALALSLCFSLYSSVGGVELSAPQHVHVDGVNTDYVLRWDWSAAAAAGGVLVENSSSVTFTVQYLAKFKRRLAKPDWKSMCEAVSERRCHFTPGLLHYFASFLLRVRAQSGTLTSQWVDIEFCPDREANLGPPSNVQLTPINGHLQLSISDPLSSTNTSMKGFLPNMYYHIQYWKRSQHTQQQEELNSTANLVILPNLDSWTWYCVKVQSCYDYYKKFSRFSPTYCAQTEGQMPYWLIFLYFLTSLVLSFLAVLFFSFCTLKSYKVLKNTFYPSITLPEHIHQYLCESPGSDAPQLLHPELDAELCCDRLDVLACDAGITNVVMEVHAPPPGSGLEQDDRTHSRHGSGDSGVYSEEGSGGSRTRPARQQEEEEKEREGLKLSKLGGWSSRGGAELLDEGVLDVCV